MKKILGIVLLMILTSCVNEELSTEIETKEELNIEIETKEEVESIATKKDDTNLDIIYIDENTREPLGEIVFENLEGEIIIIEEKNQITNSIEYNETDYPLLAIHPQKNIQLYDDKKDGFILVDDGRSQYFTYYELPALTPRMYYPIMNYADFDKDGEEEIIIEFYVGSGTGISFEHIYIFEKQEDGLYTYNAFTNVMYIEKIEKELQYELNEGNVIDILIDGVDYVLEIDNSYGIFEKLTYGEVAHFNVLDDQIKLEVPLGVRYENFGTSVFDEYGYLSCEVLYRDGNYFLENIVFETGKIQSGK